MGQCRSIALKTSKKGLRLRKRLQIKNPTERERKEDTRRERGNETESEKEREGKREW